MICIFHTQHIIPSVHASLWVFLCYGWHSYTSLLLTDIHFREYVHTSGNSVSHVNSLIWFFSFSGCVIFSTNSWTICWSFLLSGIPCHLQRVCCSPFSSHHKLISLKQSQPARKSLIQVVRQLLRWLNDHVWFSVMHNFEHKLCHTSNADHCFSHHHQLEVLLLLLLTTNLETEHCSTQLSVSLHNGNHCSAQLIDFLGCTAMMRADTHDLCVCCLAKITILWNR